MRAKTCISAHLLPRPEFAYSVAFSKNETVLLPALRGGDDFIVIFCFVVNRLRLKNAEDK